MRRAMAVAAAVAGAALLGPATAQGADPPAGAAISDNLEYVTRVADAAGITGASSTACTARTCS